MASTSAQGSSPKRIVLLGKTGVGKSSLGNVLFGENVFQQCHSANSGTEECQSETRCVEGRDLTLIDTPGLFDTKLSENELKKRIVNCITECAPGPHAFLILLKVDRYTQQEEAVITEICSYFSEEVLQFSVVVFTHGDQLPEGTTIKDFVKENKALRQLVEKCGHRCHVFDNKYWSNDQPDNDRSNAFQRKRLLQTIDKLEKGNGCCSTNDLLHHVGQEILKEEKRLRTQSGGRGGKTLEEIKQQAKKNVASRFLVRLTAVSTGVLLGAFFGVKKMLKYVIFLLDLPFVKHGVGLVAAELGLSTTTVGLAITGTAVAGAALVGGVIGGRTALDAAEEAESPSEAARLAFHAVKKKMNE